MDKKKSFARAFKEQWFTWVFLIISAIFVVFPIFWMVSVSLRSNSEIFTTPVQFLPPEVTFEAYLKVFTSSKIMAYFLNSYIIGIAVTLITIGIGIMAGYGLSRYEFKGKRIFNIFTIATQTIPAVTLLIPFFILMVAFNLYDTRWGLIVAYTSFALPYAIIMMLGYFNGISIELDEAARIDGAGDFTIMWKIITPMVIPGIISTMIYIFILSWNEYVFVTQLIKTDALRTVPVGLALLKGETLYEWNTMMAMSIIGSIPVLVFYLFGQRKFISGATAGAIKG